MSLSHCIKLLIKENVEDAHPVRNLDSPNREEVRSQLLDNV
jgi:hypothetical protein